MPPHFLSYHRLAVDDYSFAFGRFVVAKWRPRYRGNWSPPPRRIFDLDFRSIKVEYPALYIKKLDSMLFTNVIKQNTEQK